MVRQVIVFNSISIDGFYAGKSNEADWMIHDPDVNAAAHDMMNVDTILFGRTTYQMFESYWPQVATNPQAPEAMRLMADELNEMTKVVFSKTLNDVTWQNTLLFNKNLEDEVKKLKQGKGGDITIFGSGSLVKSLANHDLIDEYLLAVTPVILGKGKSFFSDVKKTHLKLMETRSFNSGIVLLHYSTRLSNG